ncbi:PhoH family protein [Ottowia thiooxydans]|uniref:PhoH-like ATPase n=1 Tax=Ottowia thiooxydans TaxID=219182 RepID=A0ABV2Q528_9BURK
MPLPPPPAKRGAQLSSEAIDQSTRRGKPRAAHATSAEATEAPRPAARLLAAPPPPAVSTVTSATSSSASASPVSNSETTAVAPKRTATTNRKQSSAPAPQPAPKSEAKRKPKNTGPTRLFVLDTNVLLHDPMALFRFEEHDIFLPMIVLEELDAHKKGMTEVARNGRQTSRSLDALAGVKDADMTAGLQLDSTGYREAGGKLYFETTPLETTMPVALPQGKADNQILGVLAALTKKHPSREVILVSKDINMRVKARAMGLCAEDYENDKTLEDGDLLFSGSLALPSDFWTRQSKTVESWQSGSHTYYRISGPIVPSLMINQFVYFESPGEPSLYARVSEIRDKTAVLKTLRDFGHLKNAVWGVTSRNREQNFALNLLMDPEIDFVTLAGTAGTGKTLLALASGLTQVLDDRRYTEIIMTRATVSVGEDIGFLPGTEEEKMGPWMGALDDNLEFLAKGETGGAGEWGRAATNELIRSRIKIKSMNFMRGRTFMNKWIIIDEAQNLTPKQMKTLITRAGPGTKIICMGNLAQIDTPYLTEGSSGLTYAVDRFKGWPHGGHITLARGERSRLADFASEVL